MSVIFNPCDLELILESIDAHINALKHTREHSEPTRDRLCNEKIKRLQALTVCVESLLRGEHLPVAEQEAK